MTRCTNLLHNLIRLTCTQLMLLVDGSRYLLIWLGSRSALAGENLFLRKQLALYRERGLKPRRAPNTTRIALVWLRRWFDWRHALAVVQPATLSRWLRRGFRLFWRWKSRPGRPPIPPDLQVLIFCIVVTATFRLLYVFVIMKHATRRILHVNVTAYPTEHWTLQQLREAIASDDHYRFLIHGRDRIFSVQLDQSIGHLGLRILRTPVRSPQANACCQRLLSTLRRECLDFLIPLTEPSLRCLLHEWVQHYNEGRPHLSLGPGIPQPPAHLPALLQAHRHQLPEYLRVVARPILGVCTMSTSLDRKPHDNGRRRVRKT